MGIKSPWAILYTDSTYKKEIGNHRYNTSNNPIWDNNSDGSEVTAVKLQQVNSPDSQSIPWLLLKAIPNPGNGAITSIKYVQRLFTHGGKAPAKAEKSELGKTVTVPYTAEYLFYSEK